VIDGMSPLVGHRLSVAERRDWRFWLLLVGALVLLVSYLLPMFPQRIISAQTEFSGGTKLTKYFPDLINGQLYGQTSHPLNEELSGVTLQVAPVDDHGTSAWAWMGHLLGRWSLLLQFATLFISLLFPLLAMLYAVIFVALSWTRPKGLASGLIPMGVALNLVSIPSLFLAWFHQFDFGFKILAQTPAGAMAPASGFWGSFVGCVLILVAMYAFRNDTRKAIVNWWALVFMVAMAIWLLIRFKPYPFLDIWNFITDGILVTLRIVFTSFGFILLVSLVGGLGRISKVKVIYGLASLYVEIVRGIPLLVQLLFIWFALPQVFDMLGGIVMELSPSLEKAGQWLIDLRLSPFTAAVAGLTVCYGAYGSEIFRAGISSIHHGQMEAARSLGMTYVQAMRYVILPQAIRVILPPIGNEFVALLKDSTLVSVLAVSDMTRRGREYMARTFQSFETWILIALCYLVLTLFSSRLVGFVESKSTFER